MKNLDYKEMFEELLDLSGIKPDYLTEADEPKDDDKEEKPESAPEPEDDKSKGDEKDDEEELGDTWEINIKSGGKFKFEMYENYLYVWYRSKKSERIDLPSKLRPLRKEMAKMFNEILSYVEKAS